MPISPIVLQRRHAELGRIRLGDQQPTSNGKTRPNKLSAFRFTSPSERYIEDLATLYGGEVKPWDNNGKREFEVYTQATSIPVIAVKGGLSQWMETWSGGGCVHRCDGEKSVDGTPCNPDDKAHQDAKPTTRLSVMLPELEAVGVWRMESHGWNAAAEIPAVAELATFVGDLVPAHLHLIERRSVKDGQTSRFVVPVLDLQIGAARLKQLVAEKSGTQLPGGAAATGEQKELEAGAGDDDFTGLMFEVEAATTLQELAAIWDHGKADNLLGAGLPATGARGEFVEAWKAKAHAINDAAAETSVVGGGDGDEDALWQQILTTAGRFDPPWTTDQVTDDFHKRIGVAAAAASAGELAAYLEQLREPVNA